MMTERHAVTKRPTRSRHQMALFLGALTCLFVVIGTFNQHARLLDLVGSTRNLDQVGGFLSASQIINNNNTEHMKQISENIQQPHRVIYSRLRKDQAGWVIFDMLKAHAYAFAHNNIYGGACGDSIHKDDIQEVLKSVGWKDILPLDCPYESDNHSRIYPSTFFEKKHGRRMGSISWRDFITTHTDYSYFGKESLNRDHAKSPFSIVVHIRRRDVTPCCYPNWYLPNSYFSSMIDKYVREQEPSRRVKVLIFSQSDSHESWDDFRRMNYTLNLDGPVGEVWRAILSADVFIGSISEFSRVPALFAKGTIPDPRNISDPTIAAASKARTQRLLEQCSEVQLAGCKHKWWMDPNSTFSKL